MGSNTATQEGQGARPRPPERQPAVSINMPAYDTASYIGEALD